MNWSFLYKQIIYKQYSKQEKLNCKLNNMESAVCNRCSQTRKIYFSKYSLISSKGCSTTSETWSKICPQHCSGKIKQNMRNTICSNLSHLSKHKHIHKSCNKRLYKIPDWTENCLFICNNKISFYKHFYQITIIPYIAKMKV